MKLSPKIESYVFEGDGIKISWNNVENVERYRVFKKENQSEWYIIGDTSQTSFLDEEVEKEKEYCYSIRCVDSDGIDYLSGCDEIGREIIYRFYDTPELVSINQVEEGIEIQWKSVDNCDNYQIIRKEKGGKWEKLDSSNQNRYVDKSIKSGIRYYYSVRCVNNDSSVIQSDYNHDGLSKVYYELETPKLKNVEIVNNGIEITWEKVNGANQYRVYRKYGGKKWEKVADVTGTICIDGDIKEGETYSYTVRCINSEGTIFLSNYNKKGIIIEYNPF